MRVASVQTDSTKAERCNQPRQPDRLRVGGQQDAGVGGGLKSCRCTNPVREEDGRPPTPTATLLAATAALPIKGVYHRLAHDVIPAAAAAAAKKTLECPREEFLHVKVDRHS